jgi:hypothetical protein
VLQRGELPIPLGWHWRFGKKSIVIVTVRLQRREDNDILRQRKELHEVVRLLGLQIERALRPTLDGLDNLTGKVRRTETDVTVPRDEDNCSTRNLVKAIRMTMRRVDITLPAQLLLALGLALERRLAIGAIPRTTFERVPRLYAGIHMRLSHHQHPPSRGGSAFCALL